MSKQHGLNDRLGRSMQDKQDFCLSNSPCDVILSEMLSKKLKFLRNEKGRLEEKMRAIGNPSCPNS
jgi:hypothetical protein